MSFPGFTIRPATPTDLGTVLAIERASFGASDYPPEILRQQLDLCGDAFLVAVEAAGESESVLGYACGSLTSPDRATALLLSVGVAPAARGRGIAAGLVGGVLEALARHGAARVLATASPGNAASLALLRRAGFEPIETDPDYFGPGGARVVLGRTL